TTSFTLKGLNNGDSYSLGIRAVSARGDGPPAGPLSATPAAARPAKPAGLTPAAGNTEITLSWDDPEDSSITGYQLNRYADGAWGTWADITGSDASTTSHTVTSLTNGIAHTYAIRAVNAEGNGPPSDAVSTTPTLIPIRPAGLAAAPGNAEITLSWDNPFNPSISKYQINQQTDGAWGAWADITGSSASTTSHTVASLANGTTYTFAVRAVNTHGNSPPAGPVSTAPVAPPAKPTGLAANAGNGQVTLSWADPGNATITGYQFNRQSDGTWAGWADVPGSSATTTSHAVTSLANGTTYTFVVRAVNAGGNSPESDSVTATPLTAPARPTGLKAAPGNAQVTLSWEDPGNSSITGYQLNRQTDGAWGAWADIAGSDASTTSHTVSSLTNGTAHTFAIRAVNPAGNSPPAGPVSATPVAPPAKPAGFSATAGNTQITLSWNDPANASITRYQVNRQTDGAWGTWTDISGSGATTTSHTVRSLANGTSYTFAVRAVNAGGNSPPSDSASATPVAMKPAKPTGLAAKVGNAQITLSWDASDDSSISKYQYNQQVGGTWAGWADVTGSGWTTTSHTVTGLSNGVRHTFAIRAVNSSGNSPESDSVSATPTYPPGAPTGFSASAGNEQVSLSWDDPFDGTITGYQYQQREGQGSFGEWMDVPGSSSSTTSHTVTSLTNGIVYTFSLRALNASGFSNAVTATATPSAGSGARGASGPEAPDHPARPTGLTATLADGQVTLSW
ncbi:MAG: fibronectin type III domain-containing protein, partial [Chloroflexota bacterium]|nr:fibronectin type III domain-containing protein [Chloroflexota bacterium]